MYKKTCLGNGLRIISERLEHLKSVSVGIWVNTGSRDEKKSENGISHFIEHMIFKGTENRSSLQIAKELDAIGGFSNAFTGKENTCFHTRVMGKHFPVAADILSDIFLNSIFDPRDVERERHVVLQEIGMVEDSPDESIHELFSQILWPNHEIGMSILGTDETVSAISKESLVKHMEEYYLPERIIIVGAGNIDHDAMVSHLEPTFGSLEDGKSVPARLAPSAGGEISVVEKKLEQVHLCLGGAAPSQRDESRFACAILNILLGGNMSSRLFQEVRENLGLAYSIYSFISSYIDAGMLGVYAGTEAKEVNRVLQSVQKEIMRICTGDITEADLSAAKEHLVGGIFLSAENADSRMMRIAKNEFIFEQYISFEALVEELEKVKLDEVIGVARDVFKTGRVSLAVLGPITEDEVDKSTLMFD